MASEEKTANTMMNERLRLQKLEEQRKRDEECLRNLLFEQEILNKKRLHCLLYGYFRNNGKKFHIFIPSDIILISFQYIVMSLIDYKVFGDMPPEYTTTESNNGVQISAKCYEIKINNILLNEMQIKIANVSKLQITNIKFDFSNTGIYCHQFINSIDLSSSVRYKKHYSVKIPIIIREINENIKGFPNDLIIKTNITEIKCPIYKFFSTNDTMDIKSERSAFLDLWKSIPSTQSKTINLDKTFFQNISNDSHSFEEGLYCLFKDYNMLKLHKRLVQNKGMIFYFTVKFFGIKILGELSVPYAHWNTRYGGVLTTRSKDTAKSWLAIQAIYNLFQTEYNTYLGEFDT